MSLSTNNRPGSDPREPWELKVSTQLHCISWYLEFLKIEAGSGKAQILANIFDANGLHKWAITKALEVARRVDQSKGIARVSLTQEELDRIEQVTQVKAEVYKPSGG